MNLLNLAVKSWELLPRFGNARSLDDAIEQGAGNCYHRSEIIGREATKAGLTALRRITFGADQIPIRYSNHVRIGNKYYLLRTGYIQGVYSPEIDEMFFDPLIVYHGSSNEGLDVLDYRRPPETAGVLVIPEVQISLYGSCLTAREHIKRACEIAETS